MIKTVGMIVTAKMIATAIISEDIIFKRSSAINFSVDSLQSIKD